MIKSRYEIPVQENGRMILPIDVRKELGLEKGDRVVLETSGGRVELTTARLARVRARERVMARMGGSPSLVDELTAERIAEARRETEEADRNDQKT